MLEQSPWWLIPFVLLMLVMLHAMMEFTVSLLVQRPQSKRKPLSAAMLRQRLLGVYGTDQTFELAKGRDCDLEISWEVKETPPRGRFAITKSASSGRFRLLLDEQRHEIRMNEVTRSYFFFFGFTGKLPRLRGYAGFQSGPPGHPITKELNQIANLSGWSVRPVLWWFQTTNRGFHLLERLTPMPLRHLPAGRFWGVLYPLSYFLGIGYLVMIIGSFDPQDWLLLIGISVIWWGVWGLLVWILCGFPIVWRRKRR